ncbi:MAG: hypothetical protein ABWK01_01640 [Infirmifilum sp.]
MTRVHRDKLECALKMLKEGHSLREIARSCGLSLTQVSEIARAHGYYVDVEEKIKEEIKKLEEQRRSLQREVRGLEERKLELAKEVENLKKLRGDLESSVNELGKRLKKEVLEPAEFLCVRYKAYGLDKRAEDIRKAAGDYASKLAEDLA